MVAIQLIRKWAQVNTEDEFFRVSVELHGHWDGATQQLADYREADQAYEQARRVDDAQATADARSTRETAYDRLLDNLATLAAHISKTQAQIHLIDNGAEVGCITPPAPPGNWTRITKTRIARKWILTRQPDKHKRATCGVCHEPVQVDGLRVQLEGQ
eukprot:10825568-Prorocentrum_lima.AAC.1